MSLVLYKQICKKYISLFNKRRIILKEKFLFRALRYDEHIQGGIKSILQKEGEKPGQGIVTHVSHANRTHTSYISFIKDFNLANKFCKLSLENFNTFKCARSNIDVFKFEKLMNDSKNYHV